MPGLVPGIHVFQVALKTWMDKPGHDEAMGFALTHAVANGKGSSSALNPSY
jgi:hypothetical protein